jgi:hypothetical protein
MHAGIRCLCLLSHQRGAGFTAAKLYGPSLPLLLVLLLLRQVLHERG